jgi:CPA1 family monovalent cation:H+ antiporter
MTGFQLIAVVLVVSAALSYINYRLLRLPSTIGVMIVTLLAASAAVIVARLLGVDVQRRVQPFLDRLDFNQLVLHGMLGWLLFAGALHVNLNTLALHKGAVLALSTAGVAISTAVVGLFVYAMLAALGLRIAMIDCLLFGALISPTDPVAVMALLRRARISKELDAVVAGESLFNDGVGVVLFILLLELSRASVPPTALDATLLLAREAIGGAALGLLAGGVAYLMLRRVNDYQVEILITLALATGGYALAERLHTSAPIAIVIAGILIGNPGRARAMSVDTRQRLDAFWELIDGILNVVLFFLIGLELLVMPRHAMFWLAGAFAIVIALLTRALTVSLIIWTLRRFRSFNKSAAIILTWSGLRGGISVALALSLPASHDSQPREIILAMTYSVVLFSIIVQGLTIERVARQHAPAAASAAEPEPELGKD